MSVTFRSDRIEISQYEFSIASVSKSGVISAKDISSFRAGRKPAEIELKSGEVIFVDPGFRPEVFRFAQLHKIPVLDGNDAWSWLCDEDQDRSREYLTESGFEKTEIESIRKKIGSSLRKWVKNLKDIDQLGQREVLLAQGSDLTREFYEWTHEIANRPKNTWVEFDLVPGDLVSIQSRFKSWLYSMDSSPFTSERATAVAALITQVHSDDSDDLRRIYLIADTARTLTRRLGLPSEQADPPLFAALFLGFSPATKTRSSAAQSADILRATLEEDPKLAKLAGDLLEFTDDLSSASTVEQKVLSDAIQAADSKSYKKKKAEPKRFHFLHPVFSGE